MNGTENGDEIESYLPMWEPEKSSERRFNMLQIIHYANSFYKFILELSTVYLYEDNITGFYYQVDIVLT